MHKIFCFFLYEALKCVQIMNEICPVFNNDFIISGDFSIIFEKVNLLLYEIIHDAPSSFSTNGIDKAYKTNFRAIGKEGRGGAASKNRTKCTG